MSFIQEFLSDIDSLCNSIPEKKIKEMVKTLRECREKKGRLFILGVGGSAATASHAVNDFRKLCGIEAYAATDNVAELSARTNDDGWEEAFAPWLKTSNLGKKDVVLVFSVGGGQLEGISGNLVNALSFAADRNATIMGLVGRDGGFTAKVADTCIIFESMNDQFITPHVEAMHGVILHLLVSHPDLKTSETKWESCQPSF